eukprot:s334_g16.t1
MHRYVNNNRLASEEAVKMFKDPNRRISLSCEDLRQLLLKYGNFVQVEGEIEQWRIREQIDKVKGGTHTQISLAAKGWTETLI